MKTAIGCANEINSLGLDVKAAGEYFDQHHSSPIVEWTDKNLAKITRLRLLGGAYYSWFDVHYCHGVLKDGTLCRVSLPFDQLRKGRVNTDIVRYAKRDKVYAKGLGVFDAISILD